MASPGFHLLSLKQVMVRSLIPGSEKRRNIYSIFKSQWRLAETHFFVSSVDQMRPSSSSLEGNIAFSFCCTALSQGFPHRHMPRSFSVQNWVSPSTEPAHDTSSSTRKHNSQVISGVESVQGSYWLSHMHPGKYKACAPGNWCYLKENRFTERSLRGFAVWQAQKTWTGADCLEFTAWKACFFFFF